MVDMPCKAKSYRPASSKLLPDLGARKVQVKLRDWSLRYVNPRVADTHGALMAVSGMNDMGHDVFFPRSDRGHQGVRVPRKQWHETDARESEWSVRVANRTCPILPEHIEEQHIRSVFFTCCSGTDQGHDGQGYGGCGPPKLTRVCNAESPTKEALVSVGGSSGSRDVVYPIPGGGLLGERPVVPGGRERTEREEELNVRLRATQRKGRL